MKRTTWGIARFLIASGVLLSLGCASSIMKYEKSEQLKEISEFDSRVKIDAPEPEIETAPPSSDASGSGEKPAAEPQAAPPVPTTTPPPVKKEDAKAKKGGKPTKVAPTTAVSIKHEPELEGQDGFVGRRPVKDPFRVGEKVVHEVSYFGTTAGTLTMSVKPFAQVNGRKSYHFHTAIRTSSLFSVFYSVDDYVSALVDFETMDPSVYTLHVKESAQLREARFLFDWEKKTASFWEKKVTKKNGPEEKKLQWEVPEHSQNVFSAVYYMRVFPWAVGKEFAFRVADNGDNLIFRAKGIRREKLSTAAGDFDAIVIKPEIQLRNKFQPVGDIFVWISDDDRRYILRIESKIKIGTLVSQITELAPGKSD